VYGPRTAARPGFCFAAVSREAEQGVRPTVTRELSSSQGIGERPISLAAANWHGHLSFSFEEANPIPAPTMAPIAVRAPARWSRPRRQGARQKLCGSYRPKL